MIISRKVFIAILLAVAVSTIEKNSYTNCSNDLLDKMNVQPQVYQSDTSALGRVVELRTEGSDLSYDVTKIEAKAGEQLTIRYINASEMYHNVVLVKSEDDIRPVGIAALQAYQNDYIPEGEMNRILAYTKLADPGETVELTFTVPPPGIYPYICTYSGHFTSMQGRLISSN